MVWSEVTFSELTSDLRLDAEYYQPEFLALRRAVENAPYPKYRLEDISASIINFGAYSLCNDIIFESSGVRFITAESIHDGYIDFSKGRFISTEQHRDLLWKSQVSEGQILVAMAARLGYAAVSDSSEPLNSSQDIAKVTLADTSNVDPYFMAAFLNSRLGREQLLAAQTGSVQQHTNLGKIKNLRVVVPPTHVQASISSAFRDAVSTREKALRLFDDAQKLLEAALGLDELDLTPQLLYERPYSEVEEAGRFDAEYFNPRTQNILEALSRDGLSIADVARLAKRKFRPETSAEFQYVEIADVTASGTVDSRSVLGEEAPSRATQLIESGDVITTTVRPIRRLSAVVMDEQNGYVCSSGFAVLTPKEIDPELLLVYLRLPLVCELLDLHTTASMYPAISTAELMKIPISLPDDATRRQIVTKVRDSLDARREAQQLLEEAKRMVERAILGGQVNYR